MHKKMYNIIYEKIKLQITSTERLIMNYKTLDTQKKFLEIYETLVFSFMYYKRRFKTFK